MAGACQARARVVPSGLERPTWDRSWDGAARGGLTTSDESPVCQRQRGMIVDRGLLWHGPEVRRTLETDRKGQEQSVR